jgi:hypothetical protein
LTTRQRPTIIGLDAPDFFVNRIYRTAGGKVGTSGVRSKLRKLALGQVVMTYIRVADLRAAYLLLVRYIRTNIQVEHIRAANTRVAQLRVAQTRVAHIRVAHSRRVTAPQRPERMRVFSPRPLLAYRPRTATTSSSRVAMVTRLIPASAPE